jgi:hypothetical protein
MDFISNKRQKLLKHITFDTLIPTLQSQSKYDKALLIIKILYNKVNKYKFMINEDRYNYNKKIQIVYGITTTLQTSYLFIEFTINDNDTIDMDRLDLHMYDVKANKLIKTFNFYNCNYTSKKSLSKIIKLHIW